MDDPIYTKITDGLKVEQFVGIYHKIVNYVDDSTNMVSTKSKEHLQEYINNYFVLLEKFYNINKLLINPDKSKLVIVCRPGIRERVKDIKLRTSNFIIHQSEKVKF